MSSFAVLQNKKGICRDGGAEVGSALPRRSSVRHVVTCKNMLDLQASSLRTRIAVYRKG